MESKPVRRRVQTWKNWYIMVLVVKRLLRLGCINNELERLEVGAQVTVNCAVFSHIWVSVTPMDCSPSGSSVHGILQARILECVAIYHSRGSSRPRDWTGLSCVSSTDRQILCQPPPGKPRGPRVSTLIWDYRRTVTVGNEKTQGWVAKVGSDSCINHIWASRAGSTDSWYLGAGSHVNTEYPRVCRRRREQGWAQRP